MDALQADFSKARRMLGWKPSVTFDQLVRLMVEADLKAVRGALAGGRDAVRIDGESV